MMEKTFKVPLTHFKIFFNENLNSLFLIDVLK